MRFDRFQSLLICLSLFLLVVGILLAGFRFRPKWPHDGASGADGSTSGEVTDEDRGSEVEVGSTEHEQGIACIKNQSEIRAAITSYGASEGETAPLGIIDDDHPLVTKGYLEGVPTCPSTGKEYRVIQTSPERPLTTECPTNIESHFLP